jgi:hypothetical protein
MDNVCIEVGMNQYRLAIERWDWERKRDVRQWLETNFGPIHAQWDEEYDYGLENLCMNEDVYTLYLLRWT